MSKLNSRSRLNLKREQKEALIKWISEGLDIREIKLRAGYFEHPFRVTQQQFHYYSRTRGFTIEDDFAKMEKNLSELGLTKAARQVRKVRMVARKEHAPK